jgi:hypothetical protein
MTSRPETVEDQKKEYNMSIVLVRTHPGNTKGGGITVPLTSCLTGLD